MSADLESTLARVDALCEKWEASKHRDVRIAGMVLRATLEGSPAATDASETIGDGTVSCITCDPCKCPEHGGDGSCCDTPDRGAAL